MRKNIVIVYKSRKTEFYKLDTDGPHLVHILSIYRLTCF